MRTWDLDDPHAVLDLPLEPGNALVFCSDSGPGGPCGQGMRITSPRMVIHWFPDEDAMRSFMEEHRVGRNQKSDIRTVVIGDWSSPGTIGLVKHDE